jgi:hypothetical protein
MTARNCRSCGSEIIWARTEAGKPIPLDAEPGQEACVGSFVLNGHSPDGHHRCRLSKVDDPQGTEHHMNHFATCPQGKSWSKGSRT